MRGVSAAESALVDDTEYEAELVMSSHEDREIVISAGSECRHSHLRSVAIEDDTHEVVFALALRASTYTMSHRRSARCTLINSQSCHSMRCKFIILLAMTFPFIVFVCITLGTAAGDAAAVPPLHTSVDTLHTRSIKKFTLRKYVQKRGRKKYSSRCLQNWGMLVEK